MRSPSLPQRPCSKCGKSEPEVKFYVNPESGKQQSWCNTCMSAQSKEYYRRNREIRLEYARLYNQSPPGRAAKRRRNAVVRNHPNKKAINRKYVLKWKYGITVEDYDVQSKRQGGRCGICRRFPSKGKPLSVDHCHATGRVRGLICNRCNTAIALMDDTLEGCLRVADYLSVELVIGNASDLRLDPVRVTYTSLDPFGFLRDSRPKTQQPTQAVLPF